MRSLVLAKLHLLEGVLQVREGTVASDPLESCQGCLLDCVSIIESFDGVRVCASGHQKIACVDVNDWVLLVRDYQLLEVMESQVIVTKEVCTLASEDVGLLKSLIQLKSNREVLHSFIQYAQASIAPASSQMKLSCGFLFLLNRDIEVTQGIVEVVQLIVKQPSEEVETWLLLLLAATGDGHIQEPLGLHNFLTFLLIVHIELTQRERVASDYADDIQAEGIFVALEAQRGLAKVFASH